MLVLSVPFWHSKKRRIFPSFRGKMTDDFLDAYYENFFPSKSAKAVFATDSDDCQVTNGVKAINGSDYAGLPLD